MDAKRQSAEGRQGQRARDGAVAERQPPDGGRPEHLDRAVAADALLAAKARIFAALGIKERAWGAFPYLVGKMIDFVAARIRAGGPSEILLSYPQWAVLANGRLSLRSMSDDSLRVPFTSHGQEYPIDDVDPALTVEFRTPERRGKRDTRGVAGLVVTFRRAQRILPLSGPEGNEAAFTMLLAREMQEAEAVARDRAAAHVTLDRLVGPLRRFGVSRITSELTILAKRKGLPLGPVVVLAAILTAGVGLSAIVGYGAYKLAQLLVTTPASRYVPIPETERPRDAPQSRVSVSSADWSGTVEVRPRTGGALLTFVPVRLPEHRASDGRLLSVGFVWYISENGGPEQAFRSMPPQLLYRYREPRVGPVALSFRLLLIDVDTVDIDMPAAGRMTYEEQPDGSLPKIRVEVKDADGTVDQAVVTPMPVPSAVPTPPIAPSPAPNTRAK